MKEGIESGKDKWITESGVKSFQDFLKEKGISPEDEKAKLLKETWNAAIEAACTYFGSQEGTDYGAYDALIIKESSNKE
jgi:hypothetical protein